MISVQNKFCQRSIVALRLNRSAARCGSDAARCGGHAAHCGSGAGHCGDRATHCGNGAAYCICHAAHCGSDAAYCGGRAGHCGSGAGHCGGTAAHCGSRVCRGKARYYQQNARFVGFRLAALNVLVGCRHAWHLTTVICPCVGNNCCIFCSAPACGQASIQPRTPFRCRSGPMERPRFQWTPGSNCARRPPRSRSSAG